MTQRQWFAGLFGAALVFSLGCQEDATSPSEPSRALTEAGMQCSQSSDPDLCNAIARDIACVYNSGTENATLKRLGDIVKRKEKGNLDPLQDQASELMADIFEDFEEGELNDPPGPSPCDSDTNTDDDDTDEVTERLLINLAAFGEFGVLTPGFLTGDGSSSMFSFDLAVGHTEIISNEFGECTGVSFPPQMETGTNICTMTQPRVDPGFAGDGKGTAPFWITLQCLPFTGPYDPEIYTAWYVLDEDDGDVALEGFDPGDPVPAGVETTACTIRDGVGLLCANPNAEEGDDLFQTTGELLNGALACDPSGASAMETEGFHGLVNNLFQPIARFADVRPLWANPGNLGLRSSFSSHFGVQFDQEGGTGSISGTVSGCFENAVGGAFVELFEGTIGVEEEPILTTFTDATNGNYLFEDVPAGDYTVRASSEGFDSNTTSATVTSGENTDADITLTPPGGCIG